jgi:hypothetical protein
MKANSDVRLVGASHRFRQTVGGAGTTGNGRVRVQAFSEVFHLQCKGGVDPVRVDWQPLIETVTPRAGCGTPRKVRFHEESGTELVDFGGWISVTPRGGSG